MIYREKDVNEKSFDDLKNELDMKRLRIHNSQRMKGRTFIQFIALIFLAQIRKTMRETPLTKKYTVKRLLWELESITTISYKGRYKSKLSEVTKNQRKILEAFGVFVQLKTLMPFHFCEERLPCVLDTLQFLWQQVLQTIPRLLKTEQVLRQEVLVSYQR